VFYTVGIWKIDSGDTIPVIGINEVDASPLDLARKY
jgi:hypothetical protein